MHAEKIPLLHVGTNPKKVNGEKISMTTTLRSLNVTSLTAVLVLVTGLVYTGKNALGDPGDTWQTPTTPMEQPIEIEIELSPAGSLKQAALWKEYYQLLEDPYAISCPPDNPATPSDNESNYCTTTIERRPGFGSVMPPLNVYSLRYNFLTGQPLRIRTSDGEVSWDQPGPLFDPDEVVDTDPFNTPIELRSVIGALVACPLAAPMNQNPYRFGNPCAGAPAGSMVVSNPTTRTLRNQLRYASVCTGPGPNNGCADPRVPPHGTVVAVSAMNAAGQLIDEDGAPIVELEAPINEEDFLREETDTAGVSAPLQPYIGRDGAEVLGKALFWDMQVGSDGVQACGSCHFHAGVDNRTRNQLNPGVNAGDTTSLDVLSVAGSATTNVEVIASDFPFHKRNPDASGDGTDPAIVDSDANDVMSSMGVSRFKVFEDIPPIGTFLTAVNGVAALPPDIGTDATDPVPVNEGVRRIEPRNTPTFHGAAFNFDNFWDGRARFNFNGGSVFGPSDPEHHIFIEAGGALAGATNGHINPDLLVEDPEQAEQPVRIKFSSLASQAVGPPLSDFEMSFSGRNWAKIGKKLLQAGATPLANQLVATDDSRLGPFSNQGGSVCTALARPTSAGTPGLCVTYPELIRVAFPEAFWGVDDQHLDGAACADPFDGYCLTIADGAAAAADTNEFTQMEANITLFFALAVQTYEQLTIPDDTPADRFFDANPLAGHGVGEPGDQAVLYPTLIRDLIDDGIFNGTAGTITLIPDDPATAEYDGFGADEVFGFDMFAGANLTAALAPGDAVGVLGINRNPQITNSLGQTIRVGSNPFTRSAKCMLCHLGPEQTDHSNSIAHGILKNDAEFEYPTPPAVADPSTPDTFADGLLPAPEPSGSSRIVAGLILAEEVGEGPAQDAVEVEPRGFMTFDDPDTPWDDRVVAQQSNFAFGDQGVYNIGLRPIDEDVGRGGDDPFGWPLSLSALTLKNIGGQGYEPCDGPADACVMANFDPTDIGAEAGLPGQQGFEETGDGAFFPGTSHTLQSINPGYERDPILPQMPDYMIPWMHSLPAGELHPQIDEMAGMVPNTTTPPNGGPGIEFPEVLFGADLHCATYNPAVFGSGPPNFGWGATDPVTGDLVPGKCPQNQSGVAANFSFPSQGTWPVPNRVLRDGAFKAPPLRNVEMTGPYFHTGSYLTLRQVVDFYMRGGDFPITNAEARDPNINNLNLQSFSFGPTQGGNLLDPFDCSSPEEDPAYPLVPGGCGDFSYLTGSFADGLPDTAFLYDAMPDTNHPLTPEYATPEQAKVALVRFMLALTDPRVKYERAPFDHPELFVPIDGAAPENTGGPAQLASLVGVPCPVPGPGSAGDCFKHVPAVGEGGIGSPLPNFLGVSSTPLPGNCSAHTPEVPTCDHFDRQ
jgi:cytochrome c peroxidase